MPVTHFHNYNDIVSVVECVAGYFFVRGRV
jgi:hypothetical protein